ncbi:MAG: rhodanese-like domain-containing protein [Pirellulaceae bacterium]
MTAQAAFEQQQAGEAWTVLDVRNPNEFQQGHSKAVNIPLGQLARRLEELPQDSRLLVHCQGGYRSSIAISLLQRAGRTDVADLVGGYQAWCASQLPIEAEVAAKLARGVSWFKPRAVPLRKDRPLIRVPR